MISGVNRVLSGSKASPLSGVGLGQGQEQPIFILLGSQGFPEQSQKDAHFPDLRLSPLSLETPNQYSNPAVNAQFSRPLANSVFDQYPQDYSFSSPAPESYDDLPQNTWRYNEQGDVIKGESSLESSAYEESEEGSGVFGEPLFA